MGFESIYWLIPSILTSFLISYVSMPVIIKIGGLKKLMDAPDDDRKLHKSITPTLGGVGIFSAFLISFSIWGNAIQLESYPFFVAALFMLFLTGINDDILVLSAPKKLAIQFLAAAEVVIAGKVIITDFGGVFGIYEVPFWVGAFLTILIFVTFVNSFNFIDGVDGLTGGIGIIISSIFGIWFFGAGFYSLAILSFVLGGALLGFLFYNMHPAKIFMGDTGSLAVGFILAFIAVKFVQVNSVPIASSWHFDNAIIFAFAVLIIPSIDTVRVIFLRVSAGQNPFKAAYHHTHHNLMDFGITPNFVSFSVWISNLVIIAITYMICDLMIPTFLFITVMLMGLMVLPAIKLIYRGIYGIQLISDKDYLSLNFLSAANNGNRGEVSQKKKKSYSKFENELKGEGKGIPG